jgi:hypothetical protein
MGGCVDRTEPGPEAEEEFAERDARGAVADFCVSRGLPGERSPNVAAWTAVGRYHPMLRVS